MQVPTSLLLALIAAAGSTAPATARPQAEKITAKGALSMIDEECKLLEHTPLQHEGLATMLEAKARGHKKLLGPRRKAKQAAKAEAEWLRKANAIATLSGKHLKPITKEGFKVVDLPRSVAGNLRAAFENGIRDQNMHAEHTRFNAMERGLLPVMDSQADKLLDDDGQYRIPAEFVDLNKVAPEVIQEMNHALKPMIEKWVGADEEGYEHTMSYGARSYAKGAILRTHTDQINTHVVSVIVNIACKGIEEQWPLRIQNHSAEWNTVYLKPGQMLFYESAKLKHERMYPFNGSSMVNLFTHFRPVDWLFKEARFSEDGQLGWTSKEAFEEYQQRMAEGDRPKPESVEEHVDLKQLFADLRVTDSEQALLLENGIETAQDLSGLTTQDMREIGLKMGARKRISHWNTKKR